jgi:hypothetical protein
LLKSVQHLVELKTGNDSALHSGIRRVQPRNKESELHERVIQFRGRRREPNVTASLPQQTDRITRPPMMSQFGKSVSVEPDTPLLLVSTAPQGSLPNFASGEAKFGSAVMTDGVSAWRRPRHSSEPTANPRQSVRVIVARRLGFFQTDPPPAAGIDSR